MNQFRLRFRLLIAFMQERKLELSKIFCLGLLSNMLSIIIPVSVGKYYDLEFGHASQRSNILNFLPEYFTADTKGFLTFFIMIITFRFAFFIWYNYKLKSQGELFIKTVKDSLFEHQLNMDYEVYYKHGISKYLLRYSGDITSLKNLFTSGTISIIIDIWIAVMAFAWLIYLDTVGGFIVLTTTILLYFLLFLINKKIEFYAIEKRDTTSGQLGFVNRTFNAIISVIGFNKENTELEKFKKRTGKVYEHALKLNYWDSINKGLITFMQFGVLVIVFLVFHLTKSLQKTPGELISFILLYITVLPVLSRLYRIETIYRMGLISMSKINYIFSLPNSKSHEGRKLTAEDFNVEIINIRINKSAKLSFKTEEKFTYVTLPDNLKSFDLIKVLLCISKEYKGKILLNERNIREYSPKSIRKSLVVISTQLPLIGNTVFEAISYSRSEEAKTNSIEILSEIQTKYGLSNHLTINFNIGENGKNLSPLELEILIVARALLTKKRIVIIDQLPYLNKINENVLIELLSGFDCKCIYLS